MSITAPPVPPTTGSRQGDHISDRHLGALGLAQFGIFPAILSPVLVSMQLDPVHPEYSVVLMLWVAGAIALLGAPAIIAIRGVR